MYTGFTYVYRLYPQYAVSDTVTKVRAVQSDLSASTFLLVNGTQANVQNQTFELEFSTTADPIEVTLFCEQETEIQLTV